MKYNLDKYELAIAIDGIELLIARNREFRDANKDARNNQNFAFREERLLTILSKLERKKKAN